MSWWDSAYRSGSVSWDPGEFDRHLLTVLPLLETGPGRVLDVGCGTAKSITWLAHQGYEVFGVDASPVAIAKGRQWAESRGAEVTLRVGSFPGDFDDRVLPARSFDLVMERAVLQHLHGDHQPQAIARISTLLANGGLFYSLSTTGAGLPKWWGMGVRSEADVKALFGTRFTTVHLSREPFTPGEPGSVPAWVYVGRPRE